MSRQCGARDTAVRITVSCTRSRVAHDNALRTTVSRARSRVARHLSSITTENSLSRQMSYVMTELICRAALYRVGIQGRQVVRAGPCRTCVRPAALDAHTIEGRMADEFYHDREFSVVIEILCHNRLLKVFGGNKEFSIVIENPRTWDFPMSRHSLAREGRVSIMTENSLS